ncbi:virulence factor TspB C-terminal domain-related protein [Oryzisolibacter sp. LB2S]|uniref:virulence factor TspB C-terminal domain-related protein n=1 Tax=Alicycliphilus soli TaxID=3228789 RepID=UPI003458B019
MDRFAKLVIAAGLGLASFSASAGYAWPSDPVGFTRSGAWGKGYGYAAAANDQLFGSGKIIYQSNGLKVPVPGRVTTMPVAYRLAANAPRYAARALYLHPGARAAMGIAAWLGAAGLVWDAAQNAWVRPDGSSGTVSDGYEYSPGGEQYYPTPEQACEAHMATYTGPMFATFKSIKPFGASYQCIFRKYIVNEDGSQSVINENTTHILNKRQSQCPQGWYHTSAGCTQNPQPNRVTQEEFEELLSPKPMPETVPQELPYPTPLPVDPTPGPWVNPEPGDNPKHRPTFIPNGDPVPNPNYNPNAEPSTENQPYVEPGTHVKPSPSPEDPWRIEIKPVNRPKPSPESGPEQQPDPNPDENGNTNTGDKPKEDPGLCELYPDILACVKLDTPDEEELPESEKPIAVTPDAGWGPDGGSCPAPRMLTVQGRQIPIPFDLFCVYMSGLRPIIIAMAWLSAAFILVGAREGD